jgi:hypothetical protein
MANTLSAIMPKLLARGLMVLREQCIMPRLVNGDYSTEAREKGDTIDIPLPTAVAVSNVTPSSTPATYDDTVPEKIQVTLDNWKKAGFHLSDKDMVEVDMNAHFIPMQMSEAVRALANTINDDIFAEYLGVYGYVGTAGTTPFATTVNAATDARKVLNQQLCPRDSRRAVLDYEGEANMLALGQFSDFDKVGTDQIKLEGEIGRKFGFDWFTDDVVPLHTCGTLSSSGVVVVQATASVGVSSITVQASATGTILQGDIFTLAGHTQTYVVMNNPGSITAGANKVLDIKPRIKTETAAAAVVTFKRSHRVNLAFHRDAFAFATRPLMEATSGFDLGNRMLSMQDPVSGLVMRLEVSRQHKRTIWELDVLWGAKLVRPELAVRIAG